MELIMGFLSFISHLDESLLAWVDLYGVWIYVILFIIIFCETGLVLTPFLPGDSLLFALGAIAAGSSQSKINLFFVAIVLILAAFAGDNANYYIGKGIGHRILKIKFVKKEYLDKTHEYYEKYGTKTVIVARFVPIVRTFAPFVAGIGEMKYSSFIGFSVIGAVLWVGICLSAGYLFGNIPAVKDNFTIVILALIGLSILPAIGAFIRSKIKSVQNKNN